MDSESAREKWLDSGSRSTSEEPAAPPAADDFFLPFFFCCLAAAAAFFFSSFFFFLFSSLSSLPAFSPPPPPPPPPPCRLPMATNPRGGRGGGVVSAAGSFKERRYSSRLSGQGRRGEGAPSELSLLRVMRGKPPPNIIVSACLALVPSGI